MPFSRRRSSFGRDRGFYPPPTAPRPVKDGLQTKSKRGAIGETWWSQRFIEVLEEFHEGPRLARGRAYARRGQVIDMEIAAGEITARVQGSRAKPYNVSIGVTVLDDADWARAEEAMASQAVFMARLLAGEMPHEVGDAFATAGLSLFPATAHDLETECSCPDWESTCKHVAAVYYLLAEAFDRDPFLIFAWRGRPRERLIADLRALRNVSPDSSADSAIADPDLPLELAADAVFGFIGPDDADLGGEITGEMASQFWETGDGPPLVRIEPRAVAIPEAILRDLGSSGLYVGGRPLEDLLAPAYRVIAAAALRVVAGEALGSEPGEAGEAGLPAPRPSRAPAPRAGRMPARTRRGPERGLSRERLHQLIEEATVDCHDESEQCTGLFEMIHEYLEIPFVTTILGVAVTVSAVDITDDDRIVAVCRRGRDVLRVALDELPMPDPRPEGAEWVDAYRQWARQR